MKDMIDLTKPIRRKCDGMRVSVEKIHEFRVDVNGSVLEYATRRELEDAYENIPEPRKPREWCLDLFSTKFYACKEFVQPNARMRVIEWPRGAPLPEWPEGYE